MKSLTIQVLIFCLISGSLNTSVSAQARSANKSKTSTDQSSVIHTFLDTWHKAATDANAAVFFDAMNEGSVYIGTDATERWSKEAFEKFARPYFERGKAWDFKPYEREIHLSKDGRTAWFSELLTTWMGVCRGSGILTKTKAGWKIEQYHLSVTVPNDAIRDFIDLVNRFEQSRQQK